METLVEILFYLSAIPVSLIVFALLVALAGWLDL